MRKIREVRTEQAPAAIGPYSQAIACGDLIFVSGQLGIMPASGEFAGESAAAQAEQALRNLRAVLEAGGADLRHVLKTTVYLADMRDFPAVNEVYAAFFAPPFPARAGIAAAALPKGALLEIDAVALLNDSPHRRDGRSVLCKAWFATYRFLSGARSLLPGHEGGCRLFRRSPDTSQFVCARPDVRKVSCIQKVGGYRQVT